MADGSGPCGACGACCRSYVVSLFGADVWRLSTGLRLAPEQFVVAHPQREPASDGFLLEVGGPRLGLALDKQGRFRDTQPCVFLLELGGQTRCGVYGFRPVVCQGYPMSLMAGRIHQRTDALCPPDSWPAESLALGAWRTALQRLRMSWDVYAEVAARWNARVNDAQPTRTFALGEYLTYLLNVYSHLDRLDQELGEDTMARIVDEWPSPPRRPFGPEDLPLLQEWGWWRYFERARAIIDRFYQPVPALPFLMLSEAGAEQLPVGVSH